MLKKNIAYIVLPVLVAISSCGVSKKTATSPVVITNGDKLYAVLLDSIYKQQDSLALLNNDGVAFFRMEFNKNHFENIHYAENPPQVLVRVISDLLARQEVQLSTKSAKNYYFVLPVRYYFANGKSNSFRPVLEATPSIDISKLNGKPINWFNQFFDISTTEYGLKGMPTILLPWLTVKGRVQ